MKLVLGDFSGLLVKEHLRSITTVRTGVEVSESD